MKQAIISVFMVAVIVLIPIMLMVSSNTVASADPVVPPITVTLPGISLPPIVKTVRVPGPTATAIIPGPQSTVRVPGRNTTATTTVTITKAAQTFTERPSAATQTTTVTSTPRQTGTKGATIEPAPNDGGVTIPETRLNKIQTIGVGTLAVIIVAGLIILGMYGGYYLGYKDSDKAEAKFLRAMLRK